MKILCSSNMPYAHEAFSTLGNTTVIDDRSIITSRDVQDADILAVRSAVKINRDLLEKSSVKFVGTATVGTDHLDIAYLESVGIKWCYSPGCNANSVSEYVAAALLSVADRNNFSLKGKTIGVVGVGCVGSLIVEKAKVLGMNVLMNDPPRAKREYEIRDTKCEMRDTQKWSSLDKVLMDADILTMHVPLTLEGPDATYHMAGKEFFSRMKPGCIFLNTARGAVVETNALMAALEADIVSCAVIDTWENEPDINRNLLNRVDIGTPHIAGHSLEGKVKGTEMVYTEACRFLKIKPKWTFVLPPPAVPELEINAANSRDENILGNVVRKIYDIETDNQNLRECGSGSSLASHFDDLRENYHVRREFKSTRVVFHDANPTLIKKTTGLGFSI
ncbi:4-phosphoerythronate dehydrogenase [Verrucomicrobiota bacterium]